MDIKYSEIGTEPITLSELKTYLKVDFDEDDTLLGDMITAARELAEEFCGRSFVIKTIELTEIDYDEKYTLPFPDHDEVSEIKINDVDYSDSTFIIGNVEKTLQLPFTVETISEDNAGLYVKYTTKGTCPKAVKIAMMKTIAEAYDNRGNANEENLTELTENSYAMLWRYVRT